MQSTIVNRKNLLKEIVMMQMHQRLSLSEKYQTVQCKKINFIELTQLCNQKDATYNILSSTRFIWGGR